MTDDKENLPAAAKPEGKSVQLHDNGLKAGGLIDRALAQLTAEQTRNLMEKAGQEALRLEVKAREQNLDYVTGRKVVEDHIDTFATLDKSGRLTRHVVTTDVKTGAGNMKIESKSGGACFVATVAYGDANHADVELLRSFRDEVLVDSKAGRCFISWYWRTGPLLARVVMRSSYLRRFSKWFIGRLVSQIRRHYLSSKAVA